VSTLTGFLIVAVLLATSLAGAYWLIRRKTVRAESERDRAVRENTVHDVGPDSLRLLKDLDLHLNLYLVDHPDVAEGFARLRQVIRDEQANTPEGE
jgi:hypothetical protein